MPPRPSFAAALGMALATVGASIAASAALSSPSDAHVTFQASGPAGLKIEGSTTELNVSDDGGTLSIDVPLANLATGIALRDHHMKEKYLEVPKYPSATLLVARSALKLPPPGGAIELDVPGTLKLHGQTSPGHRALRREGRRSRLLGARKVPPEHERLRHHRAHVPGRDREARGRRDRELPRRGQLIGGESWLLHESPNSRPLGPRGLGGARGLLLRFERPGLSVDDPAWLHGVHALPHRPLRRRRRAVGVRPRAERLAPPDALRRVVRDRGGRPHRPSLLGGVVPPP